MFAKIPTDLIKSKDISNLDFRVLSVLIMISSYNNGHSFFGSFKLSDMCGIGRAALRKSLKNLAALHLVTITQRGQFSRSNDICLTLSDGLKFLQRGSVAKNPLEVDLKDSPQVDLNDSRVDLNDSRVDLNDSPIKIKDLNNLYLNNITPVDLKDSPYKTEQNNYIATADVAAVRSMPTGEQVAGNTQQKEVCDETKAANIQAKVQAIKSYFGDKMSYIQIFEVSNKIYFRVGWNKFSEHSSGIDINAAKKFAALHDVFFADSNTRYANEREIA